MERPLIKVIEVRRNRFPGKPERFYKLKHEKKRIIILLLMFIILSAFRLKISPGDYFVSFLYKMENSIITYGFQFSGRLFVFMKMRKFNVQ